MYFVSAHGIVGRVINARYYNIIIINCAMHREILCYWVTEQLDVDVYSADIVGVPLLFSSLEQDFKHNEKPHKPSLGVFFHFRLSVDICLTPYQHCYSGLGWNVVCRTPFSFLNSTLVPCFPHQSHRVHWRMTNPGPNKETNTSVCPG